MSQNMFLDMLKTWRGRIWVSQSSLEFPSPFPLTVAKMFYTTDIPQTKSFENSSLKLCLYYATRSTCISVLSYA